MARRAGRRLGGAKPAPIQPEAAELHATGPPGRTLSLAPLCACCRVARAQGAVRGHGDERHCADHGLLAHI